MKKLVFIAIFCVSTSWLIGSAQDNIFYPPAVSIIPTAPFINPATGEPDKLIGPPITYNSGTNEWDLQLPLRKYFDIGIQQCEQGVFFWSRRKGTPNQPVYIPLTRVQCDGQTIYVPCHEVSEIENQFRNAYREKYVCSVPSEKSQKPVCPVTEDEWVRRIREYLWYKVVRDVVRDVTIKSCQRSEDTSLIPLIVQKSIVRVLLTDPNILDVKFNTDNTYNVRGYLDWAMAFIGS